MTRAHLLGPGLGLLGALVPAGAVAHGIGEYYASPIPVRYYLFGAGYAVAASFFMLTVLLGEPSPAPPANQRVARTPRAVVPVIRVALGIVVLILVGAGFFGTRDPVANLAPWLFWVLLLVCLTIASLLVGNLWERANPWRYIVTILAGLAPVPRRGRVSPALGPVFLFLLFWWELVSGISFVPSAVASVLVGYTVLTILVGRLVENWFDDADPLGVLFRIVGCISPLRLSTENRGLDWRSWDGPQAVETWPLLIATGVLLGGASFDSLQESVVWFDLLRTVGLDNAPRWLWGTGGLALTAALFLGSYLVAIWVVARIVGKASRWRALVLPFVPSLVPVAAGYTLAHNFAITVLTVPKIAGVISDPFRVGWDLFSTADVDPGLLIGARTVWFAEIGLVVAGHVAGVWLAHRIAVREFGNLATARRSQYPMAMLMVAYTSITLWFLAQPLVVAP